MKSAKAWSVGVNYTSFNQIKIIDHLIRTGHVDHVEILIDNFLTVPTASIIERFGDIPVAFHIMYSKFLEADPADLRTMAELLVPLIRDVSPIYVSDHVGRFSYKGRSMPILGEYDYNRIEHAVSAVDQWQDMLNCRLLLENFPSYTSQGSGQPDFYKRVVERTGAGMLFDISNAVIAAQNSGVPVSEWTELVEKCDHFHLGGYSEVEGETTMLLDSHDEVLSLNTMAAANCLFKSPRSNPVTLTVEYDRNVNADNWARDLQWAAKLDPAKVAYA